MFNSTIDSSECITTEKADKCFQLLHKGVTSRAISKTKYKQKLDEMEANWPSFIKFHFGSRMDRIESRSLGEFGLKLLENGDVEFAHAEWWFRNHATGWFRRYQNHRCIGVGQSGMLICEVQANLDYEIIPYNFMIEFKDCGVALIGGDPAFKATFKKSSVDACVEKNAYLVTIFRMWADTNSRVAYSIASPEQLKVIQKECVPEQRHEMGNKLCYQFFLPGFEHMKQNGDRAMSIHAKNLSVFSCFITV